MTNQELWMQPMDLWQKAVSEPFLVYAKSMQVILVPNPQMQKAIADAWSNMWSMLPQRNLLSIPKIDEKKSDAFSFDSIKDFSQMWEKNWSTYGADPFKWYIELIKKFSEFWMSFWKKSN